jgi:hypothetical protein
MEEAAYDADHLAPSCFLSGLPCHLQPEHLTLTSGYEAPAHPVVHLTLTAVLRIGVSQSNIQTQRSCDSHKAVMHQPRNGA